MRREALQVTCYYTQEGEELYPILLACFQHFVVRELEMRASGAEHHVGTAQ